MLAFHSISQVGYMLVGIGTGSAIGIVGGLFHLLNMIIVKGSLYLCGGSVQYKTEKTQFDQLGGLANAMPWTFVSTLIASLAIAGVPPLNAFVSKWMVYQGIIERGGAAFPVFLLVAMFGSALTLAKSLPSPPPQLSDILERATEQAHRAGEIIRHLREFVGKEADEMKPVNIDATIDDLETLLSSELKSTGVKLEHHLDSRGRNIKANKVQIEQVLVNLIRNSVEAIQSLRKNDGKVTLTTRLSGDDFVEVTVADNGPGVEAGMAGKMFNPFQTSKASGMGMGLSISRTIIEAHGGELWADKNYQNGALFSFRLPVSD